MYRPAQARGDRTLAPIWETWLKQVRLWVVWFVRSGFVLL